ncbi:MAG TPA: hypothetical protein VMU56_02080 [Beijerinckiaceae bacterium]|nr:hypothetical protein [Beijerinckiaceae bacterium]
MSKTMSLAAAALTFGLIAAPFAADAQSTPGAPGSDQVIPEKQAPGPVSPQNAKRGNLSDKLNKTNGVLKPPSGVDPKMNRPAPAPHPNSMRVIPPPGTPGGKGGVQPK